MCLCVCVCVCWPHTLWSERVDERETKAGLDLAAVRSRRLTFLRRRGTVLHNSFCFREWGLYSRLERPFSNAVVCTLCYEGWSVDGEEGWWGLYEGEGDSGSTAAWCSSSDGKERPGNGNQYRFRARQIGLNNVWRRRTLYPDHIHARTRKNTGGWTRRLWEVGRASWRERV